MQRAHLAIGWLENAGNSLGFVMRAQWAAITFEMPFGTVVEHLRYLVLSDGTSAVRLSYITLLGCRG
jgi:hypothetical protein